MTKLVTYRQEQIGDYEEGGVLFTHVLPENDEVVDLNRFVLEYIDCDDDPTGVVANGAYSDHLGVQFN